MQHDFGKKLVFYISFNILKTNLLIYLLFIGLTKETQFIVFYLLCYKSSGIIVEKISGFNSALLLLNPVFLPAAANKNLQTSASGDCFLFLFSIFKPYIGDLIGFY
ncbi:hypothetical protein SAMN05216352_103169 [Alteribacillus bidgolensis]|uniref:Uncharacterized protein n=1 Tax=Alteribacillus bidgolensis TaxID=930129 RepID=A0A1G8G0M1_9BACI|nr:hypothetical protein SAMN05216352_103169 [Alteribacillus bidgolensis]